MLLAEIDVAKEAYMDAREKVLTILGMSGLGLGVILVGFKFVQMGRVGTIGVGLLLIFVGVMSILVAGQILEG